MIHCTTTTIPSGATQSNVVEAQGWRLLGILIPSGVVGTTLTIEAGPTAASVQTMYQNGGPVIVQVASPGYVNTFWDGICAPYIRLTSNATETSTVRLVLVFQE